MCTLYGKQCVLSIRGIQSLHLYSIYGILAMTICTGYKFILLTVYRMIYTQRDACWHTHSHTHAHIHTYWEFYIFKVKINLKTRLIWITQHVLYMQFTLKIVALHTVALINYIFSLFLLKSIPPYIYWNSLSMIFAGFLGISCFQFVLWV